MMYYADATDATLQVSIELAELHSALLNLPVVRSGLSSDRAPAEARIKLLYALVGNKDLEQGHHASGGARRMQSAVVGVICPRFTG